MPCVPAHGAARGRPTARPPGGGRRPPPRRAASTPPPPRAAAADHRGGRGGASRGHPPGAGAPRRTARRRARTANRRCTLQPQQNAILFGGLLLNRRPTDAILSRTCSVLGAGSRDFREDRAVRAIENGIGRSRLGPLRDKASEYKLQSNSCRP